MTRSFPKSAKVKRLTARFLTGVKFEANHFSGDRNGLIVRSSNNVDIQRSHFMEILNDAVALSSSEDVLVEDNVAASVKGPPGSIVRNNTTPE